ncbi:phosphonate C-P lyase system protein PhnH [Lichenibacterium ramalinae]|uniref:Phosphonate C-P lyase system protein PhnH n=1 Tax=Lichenibacterium ramalinae TaxID=2316527 RepID=A0A4Q2RHW7_9HYPH|nr:phosphonate C-P lyase system protein PhnH [Lichenibacterium ramalinae]RYB07586.1 phosphonate C-P lyase system protein PhnH [Lichenibacterium ramalinae]
MGAFATTALATAAVAGGFADPVFDAQAVFRLLMGAMAEPGTVADLGARVAAPAPLVPAAAALLAALADGDTPVWMADPAGAGEAAARWLRFQTGAPITEDRAAATFALLPERHDPVGWASFPRGTSDYPDRSATLLLPVRDFAGGDGLVLAGPGIAAERRVAPAGLPEGFAAALAANRAGFPLGVDIVLVCGTAVLALPRSTRVREG